MTRVALLVVLHALAACGCEGERNVAPDASARASGTPAGAAPGRVRLDEGPATGEVREAVRAALTRAAGERRRVVVYVGAAWCEPCQKFHQAAARGDLDGTFPDLTLLEFDLDRDRERLALAGYASKYIPLFALPGPDGGASGRQVEGGIKGEGAVAFMASRLNALLAE